MPFLISLHAYSDWGLLFLRIVLAAIFWAHGMMKRGSWKQPPKGLNGVMRLLSVCEPLGAVAVLTGFLTQIAALGFCLIMLGAIYMKATKWNLPFASAEKSGWELDTLILASSVMLVISGPGAFSVDRMWLSQ